MDNARIHHSDEIEELVRSYGMCFYSNITGTTLMTQQVAGLNISLHIPLTTIQLSKHFLPSKPTFAEMDSAFLAPEASTTNFTERVTSSLPRCRGGSFLMQVIWFSLNWFVVLCMV